MTPKARDRKENGSLCHNQAQKSEQDQPTGSNRGDFQNGIWLAFMARIV